MAKKKKSRVKKLLKGAALAGAVALGARALNRRNQMKNQATGEIGTLRKTFPGKVGFGGLDSLARGVVEEQKSDILEEYKLFNTDFEIKSLIESLKKVDEDET